MTVMSRAAGVSLVTALALACSGDPAAVDNTMVLGLVYGTIKDEAGAPVGSVHVPVGDRHLATCDGVFYPYGDWRTNALGKYRAFVGGVGVKHMACVRVYANPPLGSTLAPDSAMVPSLELRTEGALDSVKVDFVLKQKAP